MTTGVFLFFFTSILLGLSMVSSNMVSEFASSGSEKFSTAGGRVAIAGGGGAIGTAGGSAGKGAGSGSGNDLTKGSGVIPLIGGSRPHRSGNVAPTASLAGSIFFMFLLIIRFLG